LHPYYYAECIRKEESLMLVTSLKRERDRNIERVRVRKRERERESGTWTG